MELALNLDINEMKLGALPELEVRQGKIDLTRFYLLVFNTYRAGFVVWQRTILHDFISETVTDRKMREVLTLFCGERTEKVGEISPKKLQNAGVLDLTYGELRRLFSDLRGRLISDYFKMDLDVRLFAESIKMKLDLSGLLIDYINVFKREQEVKLLPVLEKFYDRAIWRANRREAQKVAEGLRKQYPSDAWLMFYRYGLLAVDRETFETDYRTLDYRCTMINNDWGSFVHEEKLSYFERLLLVWLWGTVDGTYLDGMKIFEKMTNPAAARQMPFSVVPLWLYLDGWIPIENLKLGESYFKKVGDFVDSKDEKEIQAFLDHAGMVMVAGSDAQPAKKDFSTLEAKMRTIQTCLDQHFDCKLAFIN